MEAVQPGGVLVEPGPAASAAESAAGRHPGRTRRVQHPGLDGLRGAAVAAVLLFHSEFSWAKGGFLGVSLFFTLSGFLITGLLVGERGERGAINLANFWVRRIRRLLPALLVMLVGVAVYAARVAATDQLAALRSDALATLAYVVNWHFIRTNQSYTALFAAPSPVLHAWSLAVEEQFYLVYPVVAALVLAVTRGRRWCLAAVLTTAVGVSVALSWHFHLDHTRVYYGTDTRIAEILLGGLLALWVAGRGEDLAVRRRPWLAGAGVVAGLVTLLVWATVAQTDGWLYLGGFAAYGLVSTMLVAAAVAPGPVRNALRLPPLRWLGLASYGIYLYHWPIFLWLSPARTGLATVPLLGLRLTLTFAAAFVSYRLIEQPMRHGALHGRRALLAAPVAIGAVAAVLLVTTVTPGPPAPLAADASVSSAAPTTMGFGGHVRAATPSSPLRVLMVGDSVSYDAEPGVLAILRASGDVDASADNILGFGLTTSFYDWRAEWPKLIRDRNPELVTLLYGSWDENYIKTAGVASYQGLLDQAVGILTSGGARVLLIGMPAAIGRLEVPYTRGVADAFRVEAARQPDRVSFLDLDPAISPGGKFVSHLEGPDGMERIRKEDNVHFCPAGSARVGRAIFDAIAPSWSLAEPPSSWRSGPWALDHRFDDPPGACPS
ncbi:MAG TPA: acyltransferase family protein [Acidimicrobiales bacterium]